MTVYVPAAVMQASSLDDGTEPVLQLPGVPKLPPLVLVQESVQVTATALGIGRRTDETPTPSVEAPRSTTTAQSNTRSRH